MRFKNVFIPYGIYWSTPFCRWQGSFSTLHPIRFAAQIAQRALQERGLDPSIFDSLYLGTTVPAVNSFYGAPWLASLIGMGKATGPTIAQACATSAQVLASSAARIELSPQTRTILTVTADKTSNGPHLVYPNPTKPGGTLESENWVWDNFNQDPNGNHSMIETAENVARQEGISTQDQHRVVLLRHEQYLQAMANERAFLKRFLISPIEVSPTGRKVTATVELDEGVHPTSEEGLSRLKPVLAGGSVTFAGQTYPADGNAAVVLSSRQGAREISARPNITIQLLSFAEGRTKQAFMPLANIPATRKALEYAGVALSDLGAIKTHNPFAVNDICLANELGIPLESINNFGCSLIWGHPQGPTGMRLIIELIEELEMKGGGYGLFTGCAAGDTAAAIVLKVE